MLSDEKIDELIELIDDEIPVRDVAVTIDTYRPAIREAVRKWYAALSADNIGEIYAHNVWAKMIRINSKNAQHSVNPTETTSGKN